MKIVSLALAAAMAAAAFGSAVPVLAQNGAGYNGRSQTAGAASDDESDSGDYRDRDGWRSRDGGRDRDGALMRRWMMEMMGRGPRRAPQSAGASFRFQHGSDRVDIHCPPQQSLDDCVRAAGRLMRELAAIRQVTSSSHDGTGSDGTIGKGSGVDPGTGSGTGPGGPGANGPAGNPDAGGSRPGGTSAPEGGGRL